MLVCLVHVSLSVFVWVRLAEEGAGLTPGWRLTLQRSSPGTEAQWHCKFSPNYIQWLQHVGHQSLMTLCKAGKLMQGGDSGLIPCQIQGGINDKRKSVFSQVHPYKNIGNKKGCNSPLSPSSWVCTGHTHVFRYVWQLPVTDKAWVLELKPTCQVLILSSISFCTWAVS